MLNKLHLHGLRFRLVLTLFVVASVAIGVTAYFARQGTAGAFYQFADYNIARDQHILFDILVDASQRNQLSQAQIEDLGNNFSQPILIVSASGEVLAASDPQAVGVAAIPVPPPLNTPQIFFEAAPAYVVLSKTPPRPAASGTIQWIPSEAQPFDIFIAPADNVPLFIGSINQSFILAASAALGLAAVLSLGLSRQIIRPVEALTAATRKMEKGDLTQRVAVNSKDEIGQLAHAFNAMADGLGRADELRRNMVSDVAHELRTPLANVRGYLEAVRDGLMEPTPALIDSLHEEAMLLTRLVDDLQELALAEAGQLKLACAPAFPADLITGAVAAAHPRAADKALSLRADLPDALPLINVDAARIAQALRNLIDNAIAHTAAGGEVVVSAREGDGGIAISVRDTGEGIAPEHLPFVFERFYRADPSRDRATGGRGLGLAIVKQWVTAHHGEVRVESALGRGATFTIRLPIYSSNNRSEIEFKSSSE